MIYLITGRNGAGKTQLILRALLSDERFTGRPVVIRGIPLERSAFRRIRILAQFDARDPGWLAHWWELVVGPDTGELEARRELAPGTLFVLDESWDLLGSARGPGARDHPWVNPLKTHRHFGLDFVFLGQGITDFPPVLRELAAEHWHVSRVAGKMRVSVWKNRCGDPESVTDVANAESLPWEPAAEDREVWGLYHSADLHTAQVGHGGKFLALRRKAFALAAVVVLLAAGVVWSFATSDVFVRLGLVDPPPPVEAAPPVSDAPDPRVSPVEAGVFPGIGGSWGAPALPAGVSPSPPRQVRAWSVPGRVRRGSVPGADCSVLLAFDGADELVLRPPRDLAPSVLEFPVDYFRDWSRPPRKACPVPFVVVSARVIECPPSPAGPGWATAAPVTWRWELRDCSAAVAYWADPDPPPRRRDVVEDVEELEDPRRRRGMPAASMPGSATLPGRIRVNYESPPPASGSGGG